MKLNKLKHLFRGTHPQSRYIYAITAGAYLGELLVYTEQIPGSYSFLSLPQMVNRMIPVDKFTFGIETGIVEVVEKLPRHVHSTCMKQYHKNKTLALSDTVA